MLTHSIQETAKAVRVGNTQCYNPQQYRQEICSHHVIASAGTCSRIAVRQLNQSSFDQAGVGGTNIQPVTGGELALLQVDYPYDWHIPYIGYLLGTDGEDTHTIHKTEFFRTEYFETDETC